VCIQEKIKNLAQDIEENTIQIRRKLHQYPELAFKEEKTAKLISKELKRYNGFDIYSNYGGTTGVIGVIKGEKPGSTRALRADIDALAIKEDTGLSYSSQVKGKMHACGHDVHTAILLGTANLLSKLKPDLSGKVVLIFQPAEEAGTGAKKLIDKGIIKEFGIEMIFGYHVWPDLPVGVIGIRSGVLTSQADKIMIEIYGKGTHAAKPDKGIDPIVIASYLILAYQELISKEISPLNPVTLNFGYIQAGNVYNAIPEKTILKGTLRTFNSATRNYALQRIEEILNGITSTFRAKGKLYHNPRSPSVVNHPLLTSEVARWAKEIWGEKDIVRLTKPIMVAEDFSYYCKKVPSFYGLLGIGGDHDLHSSRLALDESMIIKAIIWNTYLAYKSSEIKKMSN